MSIISIGIVPRICWIIHRVSKYLQYNMLAFLCLLISSLSMIMILVEKYNAIFLEFFIVRTNK